MSDCYARLIAHHPYAVLVSVSMVSWTCFVISLSCKKLPSFHDPQMGFETRQTEYSSRFLAWKNLQEDSRPGGRLTQDPNELRQPRKQVFGTMKLMANNVNEESKIDKIKKANSGKNQIATNAPNVSTFSRAPPVYSNLIKTNQTLDDIEEQFRFDKELNRVIDLRTADGEDNSNEMQGTGRHHHSLESGDMVKPLNETDMANEEEFSSSEYIARKPGFFCGDLLKDYAHVVFTSAAGNATNLFTRKTLISMCQLEEDHFRSGLNVALNFQQLCSTKHHRGQICCRSWNLGNVVALLNDRSSCRDVTDADVESTLDLLRHCAVYYFNFELQPDCYDSESGTRLKHCRSIPDRCVRHNAVYDVFHFMADAEFMNPVGGSQEVLTHAVSFLPLARSSKLLQYFQSLRELDSMTDGITSVAGFDFDLKNALFDEYLLDDCSLLLASASIILILIWFYTGSLFITVVTVLAVFYSLSLAYFVYNFVLKLPFFPFMNVLNVIIAIGMGADDVFIYCHAWFRAKADKKDGVLVKVVLNAFDNAGSSMFVRSCTTAAAFFASFVSDVITIKCFSLFAGMTVLINFIMMVTWLPAAVVIADKWCQCFRCDPQLNGYPYSPKEQSSRALCWKLRSCVGGMCSSIARLPNFIFEKVLPWVVLNLRFVWLLGLTAVSLSSLFVIFCQPRLRLPDSNEFQVFSSDHPFERYSLELKDRFWFERIQRNDILSRMPITIVWGVKAIDNSNPLDPNDGGHLVMDPTFNMATPGAQKWLLEFCRDLRNQSFYQPVMGPLLPNCFIETFKSWMGRRCVDPVHGRDRSPCCERVAFPYSEQVFNRCIKEAMRSLYETPSIYFIPGMAGPRFARDTGKIKAVIVEYESNYSFTHSYTEMRQFTTAVESWFNLEMANAPYEMRGAFFISNLQFFDLQDSLLRGTVAAITLALSISCIVLFLTTLNIFLTLFAIFSVSSVIFTSVAILVLLDWKLNVLEAVAITVLIGLATDFTLHYGIAFKNSMDRSREGAVKFAIVSMGSPIFMACATTVIAGLVMIPARVLAYYQIGMFVIVAMGTSWVYSNFLFLPLLRVFGPEYNCGQYQYPDFTPCLCCVMPTDTGGQISVNASSSQVTYNYAMSESTVSTSSALPTNLGEVHEMEPLTMVVSRTNSTGRGSISSRQRCNSVGITFAADGVGDDALYGFPVNS